MESPVRDLAVDDRTVILLSQHDEPPSCVAAWAAGAALAVRTVREAEAVLAIGLRARPRAFVLDLRGGDAWQAAVFAVSHRLKRDSFSGIVPVVTIADADRLAQAFEAGADEVLRPTLDDAEGVVRLANLLRRSDRDTDVHPSSRLPGTREIEAELLRRIESGDRFAVGYADLDYFKEFNDRYGYYRGDQVIRLLARILHDVVKGLCGADGFVGHIGGDDFLFMVPLAALPRVGDDVIRVFDELIPLQYSEQDRRVGYFFGKDRRGQLHRVPLMTLSVGVVTNQRRRFTRAAEVSELATEMKSYAKTLPGSLWVVDRRREDATPVAAAAVIQVPAGVRSLATGTDGAGGTR